MVIEILFSISSSLYCPLYPLPHILFNYLQLPYPFFSPPLLFLFSIFSLFSPFSLYFLFFSYFLLTPFPLPIALFSSHFLLPCFLLISLFTQSIPGDSSGRHGCGVGGRRAELLPGCGGGGPRRRPGRAVRRPAAGPAAGRATQ